MKTLIATLILSTLTGCAQFTPEDRERWAAALQSIGDTANNNSAHYHQQYNSIQAQQPVRVAPITCRYEPVTRTSRCQ